MGVKGPSPITHTQSTALAKQTWERKNKITSTLDPNSHIDTSYQVSQPWKSDPLYFKSVKISELALLQMVIHVSSTPGVDYVGLLKGKIEGDTFVVMEAFALPVEGTETGYDAKTKLLDYYDTQMQAGGLENVLGWYRSDKNCQYLSPNDISTQIRVQQFKEPSFGLLIAQSSTLSLEGLVIEGFRTYPEGHITPNLWANCKIKVPYEVLEKARYLKKRQPLSLTYFKTLEDSNLVEDLWNIYWTRITSPPAECSKSVDKEVSVGAEKKDIPITYFVYMHYDVTKDYSSSVEVREAVFVKLVEEIGGSKSQIVLNMRTFFYANLTKEQAHKLSEKDCVKQVRPDFSYDSPTRPGIRISPHLV